MKVSEQTEIGKRISFSSDFERGAFAVSTDGTIGLTYGARKTARGHRKRILEAFIASVLYRVRHLELSQFSPQYNARIYELRKAGFPIINIPDPDREGDTLFELQCTNAQVDAIRRGLAEAADPAQKKHSAPAQLPAQANLLFDSSRPRWSDPDMKSGARHA